MVETEVAFEGILDSAGWVRELYDVCDMVDCFLN
jgi:hypothetical protein